MHKKHMQIKETPYGYPCMSKKHGQIKEIPYGYPCMSKEHGQIKETPYGYPCMSKEHGQIKEIPYGYTCMSKEHGQVKERSRFMEDLKQYFPMIRERKEVLTEIHGKKRLSELFASWTKEQQEEFLDICTGAKGPRMLYDAFFKEVMNPESAPERLNEFLSLILRTQVKIHTVLPNDSTRIADESSLLITDIVVELKDKSLANVEVQKIGYKFPGERSACYSADLLLRQYKRVRSKKRKKFSYRDIKSVYTIILFETSQQEFHKYPHTYIHRFEQKSDTGIEIELLQKYVFIPIDIFKETQQNKGITGKLDAWLMFFSADAPGEIEKLIKAYPQFKPMYEEAYEMCRNMEEIMGLFSKELRELDRNTVQLMIDEMQEELEQKREEIEYTKDELEQKREEVEHTKEELEQKKEELEQKREELEKKREELNQQKSRADRLEERERQKSEQLEEALRRIRELEGQQA